MPSTRHATNRRGAPGSSSSKNKKARVGTDLTAIAGGRNKNALEIMMRTAAARPEAVLLRPVKDDGSEWNDDSEEIGGALLFTDVGFGGCSEAYLILSGHQRDIRRELDVDPSVYWDQQEEGGGGGGGVDSDPMPPALAKPGPKAYLCEIGVHFDKIELEDDDDDYEDGSASASDSPPPPRRSYGESEKKRSFVRGFVLRYSDGVHVVLGRVRGTVCPGTIRLMRGEHLVGLSQERREYRGGDYQEGIESVTLYCDDDGECCREFHVSSESVSVDSGSSPYGADFKAKKRDHVIRSLAWCSVEKKVKAIQCVPAPKVSSSGVEKGRIAGYGEMTCWRQYENKVSYISSGLVPAAAWSSIKPCLAALKKKTTSSHDELQRFELRRYSRASADIRDGAERALRCSSEAHNVAQIVRLLDEKKEGGDVPRLERVLAEHKGQLEIRKEKVLEEARRRIDALIEELRPEYEKISERSVAGSAGSLDYCQSKARQLVAKKGVNRPLGVCTRPFCHTLFDAGHIPAHKRCSVGGCCSDARPSCGCDVTACDRCHDSFCDDHEESHEEWCRSSIKRRCGWRDREDAGRKFLSPNCCGREFETDDDAARRRQNVESKVVLCTECSSTCCLDCHVPCHGRTACDVAWCKGCIGECGICEQTCEECHEARDMMPSEGSEDNSDEDDSDYSE